MMETVKQEIMEPAEPVAPQPPQVIDLSSSSDSDSDDESMAKRFRVSYADGVGTKQVKQEVGTVLPLGFLEPLPQEIPTRNMNQNSAMPMQQEPVEVAPLMALSVSGTASTGPRESKQFWKAGDYEGEPAAESAPTRVLMDHVRVHPKFLHSNATSHKWALGALAELLDNSLDEVCSGATNVKIDMLVNQKDGNKMLLVEDDGGGMDPPKMRQCMSLGYSAKSKSANTIGQYGNGFKTSTMRLGADVIVFSRNRGKDGKSSTQTIGLLSYTFLRNTGKEDIVVPMLDYEMAGQEWNKMSRLSVDWDTNLETIIKWSPYTSESDLLQQFGTMSDQGTRIVIYNLWEDDEGELELDFDADEHDIQVRGVNRDEEKIEMAKKYPNSKHFLTYRHSLRSYASILYLRLPNGFKILLRGKEIKHHNIVSDMMLNEEVTYRPSRADGIPKDPNMIAVLKIGFVKDAKEHIDVQGFNVYHKNRLIKPFWRVWNAAGSSGRGVIGVLEANFVEPAHDKQGFERTTVLARLEARLVDYQKKYWKNNCHKIGYSSKLSKRQHQPEDRDSSPESPQTLARRVEGAASPINFYVPKSLRSGSVYKKGNNNTPIGSTKMGENVVNLSSLMEFTTENARAGEKRPRSQGKTNLSDGSDANFENTSSVRFANEYGNTNASLAQKSDHNENGHPSFSTTLSGFNGAAGSENIIPCSQSKVDTVMCNGNESLSYSELSLKQLKDENAALKERLMESESMLQELQDERNKNKLLVDQLQEAERKLGETNNEQEALIEIFSEERKRREQEEQKLRKKLMDVAAVNQRLLEKLSSSQNDVKLEQ